MKTGSKMIIIGCISMVIGLLFLFSLHGKLLPWLFAILAGIFWIIIGVFKNKTHKKPNPRISIPGKTTKAVEYRQLSIHDQFSLLML